MKTFKIFLLCAGLLLLGTATLCAQSVIKAPKKYDTQIGNIVAMLEDLKTRVTYSVQNISDAETDFLLDEQANRVGALIYHLAATEKYYQLYTFENRTFNAEEKAMWDAALNLGDEAREKFTGKPIKYYLKIWDEVRNETLKLLKTKDDAWFNAMIAQGGMNNHWAWYHVMEHQANHMGQIRLILKRAH